MASSPRSFLFVCTGNICRSPTAEGVMQHMLNQRGIANQYRLDSAGVDSHHIGQAPDPRTQAEARAHGVDLAYLRARNVRPSDFTEFDVILAMDESHLRALERMKPANSSAEIALYLPYAGVAGRREVPDPYYGNAADFADVFALVEQATTKLLERRK